MTDLRTALHEAVDTAPGEGLDLAGVVAAGSRRVRRRRVLVATAAGVAVAVAVVVATLPGGRPRTERPQPAHLDLHQARTIDPDVVARMRSTDADLTRADGFLGITADGSVVRTRHDEDGRLTTLGLLDVASGDTTWLPRLPRATSWIIPVDLGADRLDFIDAAGRLTKAVLSYDRTNGTWQRHEVGFVGRRDLVTERSVLGPDGRIYVLSATALPAEWWSFPLEGGPVREEPSLAGLTVAFVRGSLVTADEDGRLTFRRSGRAPVVVDAPEGCSLRQDAEALPPFLEVAGSRLVASYACTEGGRTTVYDALGRAEVDIEGRLSVYGADERFVVLFNRSRTFVLDVRDRELLAIDQRIFYIQGPPRATTGDGLLLLGVGGPGNTVSTTDVSYRVVRLPVEG